MSPSVHKASPPLPGGRLAFERAIRRSGLPAPARHVALTIATWADVGTGLIPERFQPSISVLAEATGMGATTVKRHLSVLEEAGWLLRDRPEIWRARKEHARTQYVLAVPEAAQGHGPERAMPRSGEDHAMGESGPSHSPEATKARSAAGHKSSLNPDEYPGSTSSSPADASDDEPAVEPEPTTGGGGGSDLRSLAVHIAASLDYQGKPPTRKQRTVIEDRLVVFLEAGWTLGELVVHLDLTGQAIRYAPAVYIDRLDPVELSSRPSPAAPQPFRGGALGGVASAEEINAATVDTVLYGDRPAAPPGSWAEAQQRLAGVGARGGTDARVAGWDALSRDLARREHQPYSNDVWSRPATPEECVGIPWCGEVECEPIGRMREHIDDNGLKSDEQCVKCHPVRAPW